MARWWLAVALAVGCKGLGPSPTTPTDTDTDTGAPDDTGSPPPIDKTWLALPPVSEVQNDRFATADACEPCHSNTPTSSAMTDDSGHGVAPYDLWQTSMMANSARDPIWRAVVSVEVATTPGAADLIGERCMACHAPMGATDAALTSEPAPRYPDGLLDGTDRANLALDGASCTLCHQIEPDNLGDPESWKGNYIVGAQRVAYGPHPNPETSFMSAEGWTPEEGDHINDAELCATCHTLITDALEPDGTPNGGQVVEQSPFLEMRNSASANSDCQSCHFPGRGVDESNISTRIARDPQGADYPSLPERAMGRHELVGGNTLVPQLFRDNHAILNPRAPAEAFDYKIARAREQLQENTAVISIESSGTSSSTLTFTTFVDSLAGHKFPTGIPLRRAWIRVRVFDAANQRIFASGTYDSTGRILGSDGQPLPSEFAGGPVSPNYDVVSSPDQVQIYESLLDDLDGEPTWLLLRGAGYYKDNRILPRGWSPMNPNIDMIRPYGVDGDPDFTSEGDRVTYEVDITGRSGPFLVEAQLLYQPLGHRYGEEIFAVETPETQALRDMLESADRRPEIVSTVTTYL